jgi:hypothetical protein
MPIVIHAFSPFIGDDDARHDDARSSTTPTPWSDRFRRRAIVHARPVTADAMDAMDADGDETRDCAAPSRADPTESSTRASRRRRANAAVTRARETTARARASRAARRGTARKPAVPNARETWTPRRVERDWTRANALEVIERSRAREEAVDATRGTTMMDVRDDFGRVPTYLVTMNRRREAAARAEETARAKNIDERRRAGRMDDDEREMLIDNLRREHATLSASYQKLPFVVDTLNRRARKEAHEAKLERIERDIETLGAAVVFVGGR